MTTLLQKLDELGPEGYGFGGHIRFAKPLFQYSTYPETWRKLYGEQKYALRDPMMFWAIANSGAVRWSEITLPDPFGVLEKARSHGLINGIVVSCGPITSRTVLGLTRTDREFDDDEIAAAMKIGDALHRVIEPVGDLTAEENTARCYDAIGLPPEEAALRMDIKIGAYEALLKNARKPAGGPHTDGATRMA